MEVFVRHDRRVRQRDPCLRSWHSVAPPLTNHQGLKSLARIEAFNVIPELDELELLQLKLHL